MRATGTIARRFGGYVIVMTEQIPEDTSELGTMTVEDDLTPDPAERGADTTQSIGDATGLAADDLQADEAADPSTGAGSAS